MLKIRLSPAQASALECREGGGFDSVELERIWLSGDGKSLVIPADLAPSVQDELNDLSNAESDWSVYGHREDRAASARAARSLWAIAGKIEKECARLGLPSRWNREVRKEENDG